MIDVKVIVVILLIIVNSCSRNRVKVIDIYFNSSSLITKEFKLMIVSKEIVLFDTLLNRTNIVKYKKIGSFQVNPTENYEIIVNGIDSLVKIDEEYSKIFIGYQEEFLYPENTSTKVNQNKPDVTFDEKYHKLILRIE